MVKKKSKVFPQRKRRTNAEIAEAIKKDRNKLYKVRSKALTNLKDPSISEKERGVLERKVQRSSNKIDSINVRLIKSSVKWERFKDNKRKIRRKINALKKEVRSGNLSDKEVNRNIHKIREESDKIRMLEGELYSKYIDKVILPKGSETFLTKEDGQVTEQYLVVWELKNEVEDAIGTEKFDVIVIDGEFFPTIDLGAVIIELDMFIADIADKQHLTATPMVILELDFSDRRITVLNNTSSI